MAPRKAPTKTLKPTEEQCIVYFAAQDFENRSEAYRKAFPQSKKWKSETVHNKAYAFFARGEVKARIGELKQSVIKCAQERYLVTQERIIAEYAKIAFANAEDYFEWGRNGVKIKDSSSLTSAQRSAVAEISETRTLYGGTIKIRLSDKQTALEKLGRTLGMFKETKTEINLSLNVAAIIEERYRPPGLHLKAA
jgi:tetratricopeptide (TPR) repeat protein